uniref:Transcriptional regulator n=1 Tax=Brugia timori TaxID=42155 RepID=A0A0R3QA31_9BILA
LESPLSLKYGTFCTIHSYTVKGITQRNEIRKLKNTS